MAKVHGDPFLLRQREKGKSETFRADENCVDGRRSPARSFRDPEFIRIVDKSRAKRPTTARDRPTRDR